MEIGQLKRCPNVDCHRVVQQCDRCQRLGHITKTNEMPLTNILEVEIFNIWDLDFMGPFLLHSKICISF